MRTYTGEKGITSDRDIPHESTAEDGTEKGLNRITRLFG